MKFQNQEGFPAGKAQYKGNLHSHTVHSDGHLTPAEAVALYRANGYHFLCFSEHDLFTDLRDQFNAPDWILLPGVEASSNLLRADGSALLKTHHMHGILGTKAMQNAAPMHFTSGQALTPPCHRGSWDGLQAAQQLCDTLRQHGCFVTYNHPVWSRVEPEDFLALDGIWGLEIYNYNTVNECAAGADTTYWDQILRSGRQIYGFASDDNHNAGTFPDSCGGWVQVLADTLEQDAIVEALLRGEFYSSSGPEIYRWGVREDRVSIDCSPCERIHFICGGPVGVGGAVLAPTSAGLRHAELALTGQETYVRVECVDANGKTAWTNALFLQPMQEVSHVTNSGDSIG